MKPSDYRTLWDFLGRMKPKRKTKQLAKTKPLTRQEKRAGHHAFVE